MFRRPFFRRFTGGHFSAASFVRSDCNVFTGQTLPLLSLDRGRSPDAFGHRGLKKCVSTFALGGRESRLYGNLCLRLRLRLPFRPGIVIGNILKRRSLGFQCLAFLGRTDFSLDVVRVKPLFHRLFRRQLQYRLALPLRFPGFLRDVIGRNPLHERFNLCRSHAVVNVVGILHPQTHKVPVLHEDRRDIPKIGIQVPVTGRVGNSRLGVNQNLGNFGRALRQPRKAKGRSLIEDRPDVIFLPDDKAPETRVEDLRVGVVIRGPLSGINQGPDRFQ